MIITLLVWLAAIALIVPIVIRAFGHVHMADVGTAEDAKKHGAAFFANMAQLAAVVVAAIVVSSAFGQVSAGHRGVVLQFGAVTGEIKQEGLYMVVPGIQSVQLMDVQVHADKSKATAASHDLQNVATEVTVNYRLNPKHVADVYRDLRDQYVERVMAPAIQEAVKSATAQFNAENLIIERPQVKDKIESFLTARLAQHGIDVDGMAITDFSFSPDFAAAIEAKVTSQQLALKAANDVEVTRNEQLKKFVIARADSYQTVTNAKAEAEAIRIQTAAINAQGGTNYVQLKAIEKWDGTVPDLITGTGAVPFINLTPGGKGEKK